MITFYVNECGEFPSHGKICEFQTCEEAVKIYKKFRKTSANFIPELGITLKMPSEYGTGVPLVTNSKLDTELLETVYPEINALKEVRNILEELRTYFKCREERSRL